MPVGVIGYGVYVPKFRIKVQEIARVWNEDGDTMSKGLGVSEVAVPDIDEDATTMAVEATRNALKQSGIDPCRIGALYVGSESHHRRLYLFMILYLILTASYFTWVQKVKT